MKKFLALGFVLGLGVATVQAGGRPRVTQDSGTRVIAQSVDSTSGNFQYVDAGIVDVSSYYLYPNTSLFMRCEAFAQNTGISADCANGVTAFVAAGTTVGTVGSGSGVTGFSTAFGFHSSVGSGSNGFRCVTEGCRFGIGPDTHLAESGTSIVATVGSKLEVTGDTTSPASGSFRLTPQDAEPTGANVVGDMYVTTAGVLKICTVAGTPGTWVSVGAQ